MGKIDFKIVTPVRVVEEGKADRITIPTKDGEITVLPKHTPLVSILKPGELTVEEKDGYIEWFVISGGIVEVKPDSKVVILADMTQHASEIDVKNARIARQELDKKMGDINKEDNARMGNLMEEVRLEEARVRVYNKYKNSNNK